MHALHVGHIVWDCQIIALSLQELSAYCPGVLTYGAGVLNTNGVTAKLPLILRTQWLFSQSIIDLSL